MLAADRVLSDAWQQRFAGIARLYGQTAMVSLARGHFVVVGLGGVGTWTAEALARTGVGEITLIDLDEVCVSNTNRQMHGLQSKIGQSKVHVTAARLLDINPELKIHTVEDFLVVDNIAQLITPEQHMVVDCMDMAHTKASLVAYCLARKIGIVTVGSAGGKQDPSKVTYSDLARTAYDPMFAKMRNDLYKSFKFAKDKNRKFRVDGIFSTEAMVYPKPDGSICAQKQAMQDGVRLDCTGGFGSATMVTGTFGFLAASRAVARYLRKYNAGA